MEHRFIGNSGLKVSALTFGNWLTQGGERDRRIAERCIATALELGITSFDTADTYANGAAEECLGAALSGKRRESLVVMSKVYFPAVSGRIGENDVGLSRKHILEGINGSLLRLGMDYVDVYQAHRFDHFTPLEETMQAFADVVRTGKALYIGVSEWTPEALREGQLMAKDLGITLISNQSQYSMLWRVIEGDVVPTSEELGISQLVWSPMAQGVLSGKYFPGQAAPKGSRALDQASGGAAMIERWMKDDVLQAVQKLRPLAEDLEITMSQMALAWVLKNPNVASAIIGASRPEQIQENVKATDIKLPQGVIDAIDKVLQDVTISGPELTAQFTPTTRPS